MSYKYWRAYTRHHKKAKNQSKAKYGTLMSWRKRQWSKK